MTEQSDAAAERSAHVTRGPAEPAAPRRDVLAEVAPGVFKLAYVARLEARLRASCDALTAASIALTDVAENYRQRNARDRAVKAEQAAKLCEEALAQCTGLDLL